MHQTVQLPRRKRLPLMVALAVASLSAPAAHALSMTATGVYTLGGVGPTTVSAGPDPTYVDIIPFIADNSGNSVFFHVYGTNYGSSTFFGSRSSGEGVFDALGTFHLDGSFVAAPAGDGHVYFDFFVDGGDIYTYGTGTGSASIDIKLNVNGGTVEHEATASVDNAGTCSTSYSGVFAGSPLVTCDTVNNPTFYGWSGQSFTADLGVFNPGDIFTLDYDMISHAVGNYTSGGTECYGSYGDVVVVDGGEGGIPTLAAVGDGYGGGYPCPTGGSEARSGDPFGNNPTVFNSLNILHRSPNPVPLPGTLALALTGAAAGWVGARRKRKPESDPS